MQAGRPAFASLCKRLELEQGDELVRRQGDESGALVDREAKVALADSDRVLARDNTLQRQAGGSLSDQHQPQRRGLSPDEPGHRLDHHFVGDEVEIVDDEDPGRTFCCPLHEPLDEMVRASCVPVADAHLSRLTTIKSSRYVAPELPELVVSFFDREPRDDPFGVPVCPISQQHALARAGRAGHDGQRALHSN